jgi:hypothetical protein
MEGEYATKTTICAPGAMECETSMSTGASFWLVGIEPENGAVKVTVVMDGAAIPALVE